MLFNGNVKKINSDYELAINYNELFMLVFIAFK